MAVLDAHRVPFVIVATKAWDVSNLKLNVALKLMISQVKSPHYQDQAIAYVFADAGVKEGTTTSTSVPGLTLVNRNSAPNSFARWRIR